MTANRIKTCLQLVLIAMILQSASCKRQKYLSQQQIRNNFILQWNKLRPVLDRLDELEDIAGTVQNLSDQVDQLETDITTLQDHEESVKNAFETKCETLDTLLDPDYDCCLSDDKFTLECVSRLFWQSVQPIGLFPDFTADDGVCSICPPTSNS